MYTGVKTNEFDIDVNMLYMSFDIYGSIRVCWSHQAVSEVPSKQWSTGFYRRL